MKTPFKHFHIISLVFGILFLEGCQKDEVVIAPKVETTDASNVTYTSAKIGGTIASNGGAEITAKGICYSTSPSPTISNDTTNQGTGSSAFDATLTDLTQNTTYYARAYATNKAGTSYGSEISFKTGEYIVATLTTANAINVKGASAWVSGEITNDNGTPVTERGFVFSKNQLPTLSDSKKAADQAGVGQFGLYLTDLDAGTTYYVRAYAVNLGGVAYGDQISFTTLTFATLTTKAVTSITEISAKSGGTIVSNGGQIINQYGLVWGENPSPTFNDANSIYTVNTTDFNGDVSELKPGKNYYVRAYAITDAGFAYGNQVSFSTPSVNVADGLVAYYKFNGVASDYSGNNRHLTSANVTYATDKNNNASEAAYFDGSTSKLTGYVDFGSSTSISVSAWFNAENDVYTILGSTSATFRLFDNGKTGFGVCNPCGGVYGTAANNSWHHVVGTYDGTDIKLYVDNVLIGSYNNPGSISFMTESLNIGGYNNSFWQGKLDKLRFYNRVISADEVATLYNE